MTDTAALHDDAMEAADRGDRARRSGNHRDARAHFLHALELERRAADAEHTEPSRSILYRSAAWLALEAEDAAEAERLAACGLSGIGVVERVKFELRAVAEEARLRLHQPLPPPTAASSVTLHLEGPSIGFGCAADTDVQPRVAAIRHMLVRTAERVTGVPFRRRGGAPRQVVKQLNPRVQYAAGSVVAQVVLGGDQPELWDANAAIVTRVREGLDVFHRQGSAGLEALIDDPDYLENFAMLATQLGPDGARVSSVDVLASTAAGALPVIRLRQRRPTEPRSQMRDVGERKTRELVGELRAADETGSKRTIKIADGLRSHTVVVRDAVMEDIVRPLYGERVRATVKTVGKRWELVGLPELVEQDG